jgi:hypothetical protein
MECETGFHRAVLLATIVEKRGCDIVGPVCRRIPPAGGDVHAGFVAPPGRTAGTTFGPALPGCTALQLQNLSISKAECMNLQKEVRILGGTAEIVQ